MMEFSVCMYGVCVWFVTPKDVVEQKKNIHYLSLYNRNGHFFDEKKRTHTHRERKKMTKLWKQSTTVTIITIIMIILNKKKISHGFFFVWNEFLGFFYDHFFFIKCVTIFLRCCCFNQNFFHLKKKFSKKKAFNKTQWMNDQMFQLWCMGHKIHNDYNHHQWSFCNFLFSLSFDDDDDGGDYYFLATK